MVRTQVSLTVDTFRISMSNISLNFKRKLKVRQIIQSMMKALISSLKKRMTTCQKLRTVLLLLPEVRISFMTFIQPHMNCTFPLEFDSLTWVFNWVALPIIFANSYIALTRKNEYLEFYKCKHEYFDMIVSVIAMVLISLMIELWTSSFNKL